MIIHILILLQIVASSSEYWNDIDIDFIIVGGGTAGSVLASRLSEDRNYQVLVLEAGGEPETFNDILYLSPGPFTGKLLWKLFPEREKGKYLAFVNESVPFVQGKGLGGSSLINSMVYGRGNPNDYNRWRDLGNPGWGYDDVLPYFRKLENLRGNISEQEEKYHGFNGPITVTPALYAPELADSILEAGREIGYKTVKNLGENRRGFSHPYFVSRNGRRLSAYKAYLEKERSRKNLHILTNAFVHKVIFNNANRATSVVFEYEGKLHEAIAKKEIIISAGVINSPKILQLSGIGPKKILNEFDIPIIYESSGVGSNLRDHTLIANLWIALKEQVGFWLNKDFTAENLEKLEHGEGPLTVSHRVLANAFIDSQFSNISDNWPDLQLIIDQDNLPNQPFLKKEYQLFKDQLQCDAHVQVQIFLLRPKSAGKVTIRSSNPQDPPKIQLNVLSHKSDIKTLISGVKQFIELGQTTALKKYGAYFPPFPENNPCKNFPNQSEECLEHLVRAFSMSGMHLSGTCKMGPKNDYSAVVNPKLRVHGVRNLRVIDNSVCPFSISSNTMAGAIMIGEKGADMIKRYWKKKELSETN